ncbi:MAG TPA: ATP-binding cassette domain-containing protein [Candidatus Aphodousia gallistercoris]|nr:ATP-binding cassette domain-containing protein [Candidatus Aphodousia gallistercoris]
MNDKKIVIEARGVKKSYRDGTVDVPVLKGIDLTVCEGELVAVVGASGSGKSTLLHVLGGLDDIDAGEVTVAGFNVNRLSEKERGKLRNRRLGFVYQFHHLLPEFTALENVAMPLTIAREDPQKVQERALAMLAALKLSHRSRHLPSQMSGGERQRCAIARAMVAGPDCILADEPTGNLDGATAESVFKLFLSLAREEKAACVIVTHDLALARRCDRILTLKDGLIECGPEP